MKKQIKGTVAACGLASSMNLPTTVAPFILRGVTLRGIDCVYQPIEPRLAAYALLAEHLTSEQVFRQKLKRIRMEHIRMKNSLDFKL